MRASRWSSVPTAPVADACLRLGVAYRIAPTSLRPVVPGANVVGPARLVAHRGSVDVFLEAIHAAREGDVLVVDNEDRRDEACIGDLVAIEAQVNGLAGIVIWGAHRDTAEIRKIAFPVWSTGQLPPGPTRVRPGSAASSPRFDMGGVPVAAEDVVVADDDGVLFVPAADFAKVHEAALGIQQKEREQAARTRRGEPLWVQLQMDAYLAARAKDPSYDLRRHLRKVGGEIEE